MKKLTLFCLFLSFSTSIFAAPIEAETRTKLETLRTAIRGWAPTCNGGGLSTERNCNQFDSIEFTGLRCLTGDVEMCDHIRRAQDETGRWWRSEQLVKNTPENAFSRDMKDGLLMYWSVTKDVDSLKKWVEYLESHKGKMCDNATDNRCSLHPAGWTGIGYLYEHLGLKPTAKMKWYRGIHSKEMVISARTAPKGYPLMLVANDVLILRSYGKKERFIDKTAKVLLDRQPENPIFQYLVHGKSEQWAKTIIEVCPMEASEKLNDFFIQRELARNEAGELIIIRDSWGPGQTRIPVRQMVNGHDCLVLLNLALK